MKHLIFSAFLACGCVAMGVEPEVMLRDNFEFCEPGPGVPAGHDLFFGTKLTGDAAKNTKTSVSVAAKENGREVIVDDQCEQTGLGICKTFAAAGGKTYRATIKARPLDGRSLDGFFIQLTGVPSNQSRSAQVVAPAEGEEYGQTQVIFKLPEGDKQVRYYAYSNYGGLPRVAIGEITVEELDPSVPVKLMEEKFAEKPVKEGPPSGHALFFSTKLTGDAAKNTATRLGVAKGLDGNELFLEDHCDMTGLGTHRIFPGTPGKYYRATVTLRPLEGETVNGVFLQLRGLPSNELNQVQVKAPAEGETWSTTAITFQLPEGDQNVQYYVYSNYELKPAVAVREITVEECESPFK